MIGVKGEAPRITISSLKSQGSGLSGQGASQVWAELPCQKSLKLTHQVSPSTLPHGPRGVRWPQAPKEWPWGGHRGTSTKDNCQVPIQDGGGKEWVGPVPGAPCGGEQGAGEGM